MNETSFFLVVITIIFALGFDVMNGFHDGANSIATIVSTRVLRPMWAVAWAAFFNLAAMFVFGPKVAETIAEIVKIAPSDPSYVWLILCAIIGALAWDFLTWFIGLPTSSSHALIGGLLGAALTYKGLAIIEIKTVSIIVAFIFLSPLIGFFFGSLLIIILYLLNRKARPHNVDKRFRKGQLISAALYSLGHGANDAQKTMGVILALMIAAGKLRSNTQLSLYHPDTLWIILSCQFAIALGTLFGGWRIVKTMGMKITKLKPIGGFAAETAGAATLFFATILGIPVSTTHTITGAIVGVGYETTSIARVNWKVASRIVWAWILTIPGAALVSSVLFFLTRLM